MNDDELHYEFLLHEEKTHKFLERFKKYLRKQWGKRCDSYEHECPVCRLWDMYDDFKELVK